MNPLQDRLRTFVGLLGISVREFERQCGIKAGTARRITEKSYSTTFHKIQECFPQLIQTWLKTGEGMMIENGVMQTLSNIGSAGHDINQASRDLIITEPCHEHKDVIDSLRKEVVHLTLLLTEREKRVKRLKSDLDRSDAHIDRLMALLEKK